MLSGDLSVQASCAVVQAATREALQRGAAELAARYDAGERGVLRAGGEGAFRAALTLRDADDLAALLRLARGAARPARPRASPAPLAFLYPGQGAQRPGAARWWVARPAFRAALDACAEVLDRRLPRALRELLLDPQAELDATSVTQPVLVAFSLALTAQWRAWGVAPDWVAGHSLGEFSAAQAAGCCALDALLELVAERGRLMQDLPAGAMAAVFAPPARVAALLADLGGAAWVAADNGPDDAVIAGPPAAVARALRLAVVEGLEVRPLPVAFAAHGPAVATSLDGLAAASARVAWRAPRCGWVSTRTGASQVAPPDAAHWRGHTRDPVRFGAALTALRAQRVEFMLELGPGASLARLAGRALPEVGVASSVAGDDDPAEHVLGVATRLWDLGVPIAWEQLHADVSL